MKWKKCPTLPEVTLQVNRLDFNAWKCWQTCHYIELSGYKLYMGHIHTLVLTKEWIAMLVHRETIRWYLPRNGLPKPDVPVGL